MFDLAHVVGLQHSANGDESNKAQRNVDVEDAAPGQALDKEAAHQGSDHAGNPEYRSEIS